MSGVGPIELVVLAIIVMVLFGPTLIAFWLGFTLGRKSTTPPDAPRAAIRDDRVTPTSPPASPAATNHDTPAPAEEPADE